MSGYLRDRCPLLVDRHALREAGLDPRSLVTIRAAGAEAGERSMPWEEVERRRRAL